MNVRKSAKTLTSRAATHADIPLLLRVMEAAISELQREFLDEAQIRASRAIMGLDTQLIDDDVLRRRVRWPVAYKHRRQPRRDPTDP